MRHVKGNIYEHGGVYVEAVPIKQVACDRCPLAGKCAGAEFICSDLIGFDRHFVRAKLESLPPEESPESTNARPRLAFKCIVLHRAEEDELLRMLHRRPQDYNAATFWGYDSETGLTFSFSRKGFDAWELPLMTVKEAISAIKAYNMEISTVPEFNINPDDIVLMRDAVEGMTWEHFHFSRIATDDPEYAIYAFGGIRLEQMIKAEGNEHFLGTSNTPNGWWEVKDGKPVWVRST